MRNGTTLQGTNSVPLIGYGLVVGLNKTGDRRQTIFPAQTLANMLERLGRGLTFVAGSVVGGLALAFIIVALHPDLIRRGDRFADENASNVLTLRCNVSKDAGEASGKGRIANSE